MQQEWLLNRVMMSFRISYKNLNGFTCKPTKISLEKKNEALAKHLILELDMLVAWLIIDTIHLSVWKWGVVGLKGNQIFYILQIAPFKEIDLITGVKIGYLA